MSEVRYMEPSLEHGHTNIVWCTRCVEEQVARAIQIELAAASDTTNKYPHGGR